MENMTFVTFVYEDNTWEYDFDTAKASGKKISAVVVDFLGLSKLQDFVPKFFLSGYEKYMFQKYGDVAIGMSGNDSKQIPFSGFEVGAYNKDRGWVIFDANFTSGTITVLQKESITSIAILEGAVK